MPTPPTGAETQLVQQGARVAQQAVGQVAQSSGSFLGSLLMSPINLLANTGRGAVNGLIRYFIPALLAVGGIFMFAPDLIRGITGLFGRTDLADSVSRTAREGGAPAVALTAAGTAAALASGLGALLGVKDSLFGNGSEESPPSGSSRVGSFIGTAGTAVAIGAIIRNASMNRDGSIRHDPQGDGEVTPPPRPRRKPANAESTV